MKVLITGINGFVGSHMTEYCLKKNCEVFGLVRHRSNLENIKQISDKIILYKGTITDSTSVDRVIKEVSPEIIFHLAAQSFVPYSWIAPQETILVNVLGAVNILEAVKKYSNKCIVLLVGTSEEYGLVFSNEIPIIETNQLRPLSPYGVSKVAQENLGYVYYRSYGIKVILTRGFNHFCSRRGEEFVESRIIKQAIEILSGKRKTFTLGNLSTIRDFTDARDMVRCYYILCNKAFMGNFDVIGTPFNLCSGVGYKIQDILEMVCNLLNIDPIVEIDNTLLRPKNADVPILIGNSSKVEKIIGKINTIPLKDSLADLIMYWKDKILNK